MCSPLPAIPDKIITWRWKQPDLEEDDEEEPLSGTYLPPTLSLLRKLFKINEILLDAITKLELTV